jgi:hypothetical protein
MRAFARAISLLPIAALAGCAKEITQHSQNSSAISANHLVAVQKVSSLPEAIQQIQSGSLTCTDSAHCPANVGMLLAADAAGGFDPHSDAVLACTAALVGDDLVLTNSHCIPSAVKLLPDLCASRVRISLPNGATLACAQLVGFSARETPTSPDLALLRLEKKTGIAPLAIARSGVEPAAVLHSFRVNPDLKNRTGSLVASDCVATAGAYRMPVYNSSADSQFVTGDCQAVAGNSGSPVLGDDGAVHGLLQADLPISASTNALWLPRLDGGSTFAPLAMGTSLACLAADPAQGWSWNPACTTISDEDVAIARPRMHELLARADWTQTVTTALLPYLKQSPVLDFAPAPTRFSALDAFETLAPSCFRAQGTASVPISAKLPEFTTSVRFNRFTQLLAPRIAVTAESGASYELAPQSGELTTAGADPLVLLPCAGAP